MKKMLFLVGSLAVSIGAYSQSVLLSARVIRSVPAYRIAVEHTNQCVTETVTPTTHDDSGILLGAVIGGAIGNQMGKGSGRDAATAIGLVGGAIVGDKMKNSPTTAQRCFPVSNHSTVLAGYDVTWEFNGRQVTQRLTYDPGYEIKLLVTPSQ